MKKKTKVRNSIFDHAKTNVAKTNNTFESTFKLEKINKNESQSN
jgi:hypothetical protein